MTSELGPRQQSSVGVCLQGSDRRVVPRRDAPAQSGVSSEHRCVPPQTRKGWGLRPLPSCYPLRSTQVRAFLRSLGVRRDSPKRDLLHPPHRLPPNIYRRAPKTPCSDWETDGPPTTLHRGTASCSPEPAGPRRALGPPVPLPHPVPARSGTQGRPHGGQEGSRGSWEPAGLPEAGAGLWKAQPPTGNGNSARRRAQRWQDAKDDAWALAVLRKQVMGTEGSWEGATSPEGS